MGEIANDSMRIENTLSNAEEEIMDKFNKLNLTAIEINSQVNEIGDELKTMNKVKRKMLDPNLYSNKDKWQIKPNILFEQSNNFY